MFWTIWRRKMHPHQAWNSDRVCTRQYESACGWYTPKMALIPSIQTFITRLNYMGSLVYRRFACWVLPLIRPIVYHYTPFTWDQLVVCGVSQFAWRARSCSEYHFLLSLLVKSLVRLLLRPYKLWRSLICLYVLCGYPTCVGFNCPAYWYDLSIQYMLVTWVELDMGWTLGRIWSSLPMVSSLKLGSMYAASI